MRRILWVVLINVVAAGVLSAQATRTWVSGVGDDVNPCSRTAPCKTFAGAISKTAAGGEISVLDPGGYGAVTITKSITIDGSGTHASILHSGTNGVVINTSAGAAVILRDLSFHGGGTGLNAIRVIGSFPVALHVENCDMQRAQRAFDIAPSVQDFRIAIKDTDIRQMTDDAIEVQPSVGATTRLSLQNVRVLRSTLKALHLVRDTQATVVNSSFQSSNTGVQIGAATVRLTMVDSVMSENTGVGLLNNAAATVRLDGCTITNNDIGIQNNAGGSLFGYGNNMVEGNFTANVQGGAITTNPHP